MDGRRLEEGLLVRFCRAREKRIGKFGPEMNNGAIEVEGEDRGGVVIGISTLSVAWISAMRSEMASTESSTVIFRSLRVMVDRAPSDRAIVLSESSLCSICMSIDVMSEDSG